MSELRRTRRPMTLQERRRQAVKIRDSVRLAREQLGAALEAMDNEKALICQIEIDALERGLNRF